MKSKEELKREALQIKNEKEYNAKIIRLHKQGLKIDKDILEHFDKILSNGFNPLKNGIITEVQRKKVVKRQ